MFFFDFGRIDTKTKDSKKRRRKGKAGNARFNAHFNAYFNAHFNAHFNAYFNAGYIKSQSFAFSAEEKERTANHDARNTAIWAASAVLFAVHSNSNGDGRETQQHQSAVRAESRDLFPSRGKENIANNGAPENALLALTAALNNETDRPAKVYHSLTGVGTID